MAKLTNDAESTADGYDWAGVYLTDVLARVALLKIIGSYNAVCKNLLSCLPFQTGFGISSVTFLFI